MNVDECMELDVKDEDGCRICTISYDVWIMFNWSFDQGFGTVEEEEKIS